MGKYKVLCVCRTSTVQQDIIQQHEDMKEWLTGKFKESEILFLEAQGASAIKQNQLYRDMIDNIKATLTLHDIRTVAVFHLNRLGRTESALFSLKDYFVSNGIQLLVKNPDITLLRPDGTLDPAASLAMSIFCSMVSYETQEMLSKMRRGIEFKRQQGMHASGRVPFGFKVENDYVVPDETNMNTVRWIFNQYATGNYSTSKLSEELASIGVTISDRQILYILTADTYKPYIDKDVLSACDNQRKNHAFIGTATKESKYTHLALRLIHCQCCGGLYMAVEPLYYGCYNNHFKKRVKVHCEKSFNVRIQQVDDALLFIANMYHIEYMTSLSENSRKDIEGEIALLYQKINTCNSKIQESQPSIDRATELYVMGTINKERYNQLTGKVNGEVLKMKADIAAHEKRIKELKVTLKEQNEETFSNIALDIYNIKDPEERSKIVHRHIKSVEVEDYTNEGRKAVLIKIYANTGTLHTLFYERFGKNKLKLQFLNSDGSVTPFPYEK